MRLSGRIDTGPTPPICHCRDGQVHRLDLHSTTRDRPVTAPSSASARSVAYETYALICRPGGEDLLLIPDTPGGDWSLPWFRQKQRHFWQEVGHVNQAVADRLGLRAATLRCLHTDYDPAQERVRTVYALESLDPSWQPPAGARWATAQALGWTPHAPSVDLALEGSPITPPVVAESVAAWFASRQPAPLQPSPTPSAPARVPWYEPGWFGEAEAWIHNALGQVGRTPTGPMVQVRSWQRSCLVQIETDLGQVYFKAVPAMFAHEPAITHALAGRFPRHIPQVLARHPGRPWFLMEAVPGRSLETSEDPEIWERAVRTFALIQIDLISRAERLQDLGCPRRPLSTLVDQVQALLDDESLLLTGRPAGLSPEELTTIRGMLPELGRKARRLAEIPVPATLEHGDFWPGQVLIVPEIEPSANGNGQSRPRSSLNAPRAVFIDWSDCSIAHPFFSLSFFDDILEMEGFVPDVANLRERLRTAYLGPWTLYAPMPQLVEAFELARPLAAIHNALIYQQQILPGMAQRWEMHYMPPFFLKKLLRNYDRAVAA